MPPTEPHATLPEDAPHGSPEPSRPANVMALVVLWSADSPSRVGEVALFPAGGPPRALGRGGASAGDDLPRAVFVRERGGAVDDAPPLASPRVSRTQLVVRAGGRGELEVRNVGKLPLRVNGVVTASATVRASHLLELGQQLLLGVAERPVPRAPRAPRTTPVFARADRHGIVGESPAIWQLRDEIEFVGARAGHVLVHGASGTGKELVARAIHASSTRASRPMTSRNAATFPEGLIDAELFGNAKNYPNAGMPERAGIIGDVDGSTLFLDEFADLPASVQSHLLRVLDAGEYQRLGESRVRSSDFRLVAATNRPLSMLKHDLLARFVFRVELPDFNARREDVPLLLRHVLTRIAEEDPAVARRWFRDDGEPRVSLALVRTLVRRAYTTNMRELESIVWRALQASGGAELDLPPEAAAPPMSPAATATSDRPRDDEDDAHELSPARVQAALDASNGVIEDTWRGLGLPSRYALARLIKKHGLELRRRPRR